MTDFTTYTHALPNWGGTPNQQQKGTSPWYSDPNLWINFGSQLLDTGAGIYSASRANSTNIRLQREQREWQKMMSDSEIQRRKKDYELAGFNPALAATEGGGASSPVVSSARVEPTFRPGGLAGLNTAAQVAANIQNVRADTLNKVASARIQNVEANIREGGEKQEFEARVNTNIEQVEWNDLKTRILRSQDISSAAGAKVDRETVDEMISMAQSQAKTGKLDADALENIAKVGGVEAGKIQWLIKMIVNFATTASRPAPIYNFNRGRGR